MRYHCPLHVENITETDKEIATVLDLTDRIECSAVKKPSMTVKDHKDNFRNNPTSRLINP